MRSAVLKAFADRFGGPPEVLVSAPGRVNLIGEHTDYSEGWVMPAAIDRRTWIAARRTRGATQLHSLNRNTASSFDAADVLPGQHDWGAYVAGVAWALGRDGFEGLCNVEAVVGSDVPIGSGLSSSAALAVAAAALWDALLGLGMSLGEIARVAHAAETGYVGVGCGMMDQTASALGREGHAMRLDTRSLEVVYVPVPSEWVLVVCDTLTPRTLAGSAYNERRREVEHAAQVLGVASLRDADVASVEAGAEALGPVLLRRALHVVTENARVERAAEALLTGDAAAMGAAMRDSHESLRDRFEVSSPALDAMAEAAWASSGCVGARMTGAGFGGACLAIVLRDGVEAFLPEVRGRYRGMQGTDPDLMVVQPSSGVRVDSRIG